MNNELIKHIGYKEIVDIISKTKDNLIISLPNIYLEIADSIIEYSKNISKVRVIIDNSEDNFRNGFGDYKDVEKLRKKKIDIYEIKGNMVSFIIADNTGYFLFPQSRIFSSGEDTSSNAVLMDDFILLNIKSYFFPPESDKEKEVHINEIIETKSNHDKKMEFALKLLDGSLIREYLPAKFDSNNFEEVKKSLINNPPDHPDFKRKIQTYIAKIQFVELTFTGINFHINEVKIPSSLLPYKNEEIKKKFHTKMKLFENVVEKKEYKNFMKIKDEYESFRNNYLKPITCREKKSILEVKRKKEFITELEELKKKLTENNNTIKLLLQEELLNSIKSIKDELINFLNENPPDKFNEYKSNVKLFEDSVIIEVEKLVSSIKFPDPNNIFNKMEIKHNIYDLTYEDFRDKNLLEEFIEREIMKKNEIKEIVKITNAFAIKT